MRMGRPRSARVPQLRLCPQRLGGPADGRRRSSAGRPQCVSVPPATPLELVAFRQPQRPNELAVKRVVGLPEESIAIRAGDVYVDGQIVRKTLPQQHALAVLVHDSRYRSTDPALPPRWHGVGAESQWEAGEGRFGHPAGDASAAIDWLIYSHWRRSATDGKVVATPVTDLCGYNQSLPRREEDVHATPDLLLSLRLVEEFGEGLLILRACDGGQRFEARIDPRHGRYEVRQNDWPLPTGSGCLPARFAWCHVGSVAGGSAVPAGHRRPHVGGVAFRACGGCTTPSL